jgi:hypothetical protein
VKTGFRSSTMYQHQSTLRLVLQLLNISDMPGASAVAPQWESSSSNPLQ